MGLKLKGKLTRKFETQEIEKKDGGKFQKRGFQIETDQQYNNMIHIEIIKEDVIKQLDLFEIGTEIEVDINLHSREYNMKFYHNITAWMIKPIISGTQSSDSQGVKEDDDVPF